VSYNDVDIVRMQIQDRASPFFYSDAEINAAIAQYGDTQVAAGWLLRFWVIYLLRQPNFTLGSFSENHGSSLAELEKKADELIASGTSSNAGLYAGGISKADVETSQADEDRVQPYFTTGMLANPDAGSQEGTV